MTWWTWVGCRDTRYVHFLCIPAHPPPAITGSKKWPVHTKWIVSTNPMCLQGKLTCQGKLLQQETFFVTEQDAGVLSRSKERRVFLFEQIVIFSELLRKGSSTPGYQFKKSIKVHRGQAAAGGGVSLVMKLFKELINDKSSSSVSDWSFQFPSSVFWLQFLTHTHRCPTWVWRTAWTTIPVSSSCRVAARRNASPCRPLTSTSSRSGSDTSGRSWMLRATSCRVRQHTHTNTHTHTHTHTHTNTCLHNSLLKHDVVSLWSIFTSFLMFLDCTWI